MNENPMKSAMDIRREMAEKGWISEDIITWMGWGCDEDGQLKYGYHIFFRRRDWHGRALQVVGPTYHASTGDLHQTYETVKKAAGLALKAWDEYPDWPPSQLADGTLQAEKPLG